MTQPMNRAFLSRRTIADLILFPALFLFVWLRVNTSYLYQYAGFSWNLSVETYASWFISHAPQYPGRLTDVIVSFLTPVLASTLAGAAILTLITCVMCWLLGRFLDKTGAGALIELRFVPGALMLLHLCCAMNPLPGIVSITLGLACVWLSLVLGRLAQWQRVILFVLCSAAMYAAAPYAFVAFVCLCIAFDVRVWRNFRLACVDAVVAALVPIALSGFVFPLVSPLQAYGVLMPNVPGHRSATEWLPFVMWMVLPFIAFVAAFGGLAGRVIGMRLRSWKRPRIAPIVGNGAVQGILAAVVMALLTACAAWICRSAVAQARANVTINFAMRTKNWDLLLDEAGRVPKRFLTTYHVHAIDRALYYKGRLLEDLFKVPQNQSSLLLFPFSKSMDWPDRLQKFIWGGQTWFELGLVNIAEHCGLEAVTQCYFPQGLQLLAKIYVVKDMPEAGRTCLAALEKDIGFRAWAKAYSDSLSADSAGVLIPELRHARAVELKSEFVLAGDPPLASLVQENPGNTMAFEYLVAWNLIERNVDSLVKYAGLFRELHYSKIPLLMEEALLLSNAFQESRPELSGYSPSPEASASFSKFYKILYTNHGGKPDEAFNDLAASCGDSYFFYYTYGFSQAIIDAKK
jgi:hypothetical protein